MSTLVKSNGFTPATDFFDDFLTKDFFDWTRKPARLASTMPPVNIAETNDEYVIELAAPGKQKADFKVELDQEVLEISVPHEDKAQDENLSYSLREFNYGHFHRSFNLPNTVNTEKIEASYRDGILRVVVPKKDEAKKKPARSIKIS